MGLPRSHTRDPGKNRGEPERRTKAREKRGADLAQGTSPGREGLGQHSAGAAARSPGSQARRLASGLEGEEADLRVWCGWGRLPVRGGRRCSPPAGKGLRAQAPEPTRTWAQRRGSRVHSRQLVRGPGTRAARQARLSGSSGPVPV